MLVATVNFKLRTTVGFLEDLSNKENYYYTCGILVLEDKLSSHLRVTCVIYTKFQTKSDVNQNWLM